MTQNRTRTISSKTRIKRTAAMTFVEIMVAGLLLVVVFVIGWVISSSFTGVKKVRDYETAIYLANQAIEAVRSARWHELGSDDKKAHDTLLADFNSNDNHYDKEGEGFVPNITVGNIDYTRKVSIKPVESTNKAVGSGLVLITVNVSWRASEDGEPVEYEVVTAQSEQW